MNKEAKRKKYIRIYDQLEQLLLSTSNYSSNLATIESILHHKMQSYFWTGVYLIHNGELLVHSYQGPVACQKLAKNVGVCWAAINRNKTIVVGNVEEFDGHIACNSATKSEIVVPLRNSKGEVIGCFDVDSREFDSFDEVDAQALERILSLLKN